MSSCRSNNRMCVNGKRWKTVLSDSNKMGHQPDHGFRYKTFPPSTIRASQTALQLFCLIAQTLTLRHSLLYCVFFVFLWSSCHPDKSGWWLYRVTDEQNTNTSVFSELTLTLKCNFHFSDFVGFAKAKAYIIHTGTTMKGGRQMATLSTTVLVSNGVLLHGIIQV